MSLEFIVMVIVGILSMATWTLYYGLYCLINGGGCVDMLKNAKQDFLYAMPGGRQRKADFIRKMVWWYNYRGELADGYLVCKTRSWTYAEIRDRDLYEVVGRAMLPGFWHFVFSHVMIPFGPMVAVKLAFFFLENT